jgi:hypothetical protein
VNFGDSIPVSAPLFHRTAITNALVPKTTPVV